MLLNAVGICVSSAYTNGRPGWAGHQKMETKPKVRELNIEGELARKEKVNPVVANWLTTRTTTTTTTHRLGDRNGTEALAGGRHHVTRHYLLSSWPSKREYDRTYDIQNNTVLLCDDFAARSQGYLKTEWVWYQARIAFCTYIKFLFE